MKTETAELAQWRVAKKIRPDGRGAIKLARRHGPALVCVRYRENAAGTERLTTVELVVERVLIQKRPDPIVLFKIRHDEQDLQRLAQSRGAISDGQNGMWKLRRSEVLRMGLKHRIAVSSEQLLREHVPV